MNAASNSCSAFFHRGGTKPAHPNQLAALVGYSHSGMALYATCLPVSSGETDLQRAHGRKIRHQLDQLILHTLAGAPGCLSGVRILLRG